MGYRLDINKYDKDGRETNIFYGTKLIGYTDDDYKLLCVNYLYDEGLLEPEDVVGWYCTPTIEVSYSQLVEFINLYFFDLMHDRYVDLLKDALEHNGKFDYKNFSDYMDDWISMIDTIVNGCDEFDTITIGWC